MYLCGSRNVQALMYRIHSRVDVNDDDERLTNPLLISRSSAINLVILLIPESLKGSPCVINITGFVCDCIRGFIFDMRREATV